MALPIPNTGSRPTVAMGNIQRVVQVQDLADNGYDDPNGFFIRVGVTGYLRYCPIGNAPNEWIEKEFEASSVFNDPEICRTIYPTLSGQGELAGEVYVGYGV